MTAHQWFVGPGDSGRGSGPTAGQWVEVDCHRRRRGPYTGLGTLLRALVPEVYQRRPELVRAHAIAILSVAPELTNRIDAAPETLTSLAVPGERTRLYPANRTRRLAHGAVEFLESSAAHASSGQLVLSFGSVDQADQTDQEFLAILLRRARSGRIRVIVRTNGESVRPELAAALNRHARRVPREPQPARSADTRTAETLLRAYVEADGTSTDPAEVATYAAADVAVRAALHDARAAELDRLGEATLRLGAIPYHLEHGSDSTGAGGAELLAAAYYCIGLGFYDSVLEYGPRGLGLTDPREQSNRYWELSTKITTALFMLRRSDEAEPIYADLRSRYTLPIVHLFCSYALAMLYTRFHEPQRRDHHLAKIHMNNAVAIASHWPEPQERAFHTVFQQNGLALVETHLGNLPEALRLVTEGLDRLDRELPGDRHRLHRSVLVHNRAKVYAGMGRLDDALIDFDRVIEVDPNYPDYYFDRADIRRRLGDPRGAIADYDVAITLTEPFYELHYNRADLRAEIGDTTGAIADLSYVVELEPDQLDARVNLISLLMDGGAQVAAVRYVDEGLRLHVGDSRLLYLGAVLAAERGDYDRAGRDFDRAVAADPTCVAALAGRATLAHEAGDHLAAVADLTAAIKVADDPDLRYNRGLAHQAAQDWRAAIADYSAALALPGADRAEVLRQRALCNARLGDDPAHRADLAAIAMLQEPAVVL